MIIAILMQDDLPQQAIQAALRGEWKIAQNLNQRILEANPQDPEAMLRLANAVTQLGKIPEAIKIYQKILKLDPYNIFAQKNLERLKKIKKGNRQKLQLHALQSTFLEEPGKTRTVALTYTAGPQTLASLDTGEPVSLTARRRRICITTQNGTYVGRFPDDLSSRLLALIKGGNVYEAAVKAVTTETVKVFVREVKRSTRFVHTPSFPADEFMIKQ